MNLKIKSVDAACFIIPPTFAPVITFIKGGQFNKSDIWMCIIAGFVAFWASLGAYRSTKYARENFNLTEKPPG